MTASACSGEGVVGRRRQDWMSVRSVWFGVRSERESGWLVTGQVAWPAARSKAAEQDGSGSQRPAGDGSWRGGVREARGGTKKWNFYFSRSFLRVVIRAGRPRGRPKHGRERFGPRCE
ncbi:hypothetical protein BS78_08G025000 [Paspalum vaginatum]|nr:hypothetical protein BS78_08G025000 [Paspalum vaginatum]